MTNTGTSAELHARSAFSFLRGASAPEEIASTAAALGLRTVALCDRQGVYAAPRFARACHENGVRPVVGCELWMEDESVLPVLVERPEGYRNLCTLLSRTHLHAPKGQGRVRWTELAAHASGLVALSGDEEGPVQRALEARGPEAASAELIRLREVFGEQALYVELQRHRRRGEERTVRALAAAARDLDLGTIVSSGALYARPTGRRVLDVFTCLRTGTRLDDAGLLLSPNSQRHLQAPAAMQTLFSEFPDALALTNRLAERLEFRLENLGYQFPVYDPPDGLHQREFLRRATLEGARNRYGRRIPVRVLRQLAHELELIGRLGFDGYFLTVWEIVNFCRSEGILVQGRGSAANSAVCYCLGITAVDAVECNLLFERFLSEGRRSWPDIDLDLPSGARREAVIQEVYRRHGREGAAMTANVITYRGRSAARELGKVLDLPAQIVERFSALFAGGDYPHTLPAATQLREAGIAPEHPRIPAFLQLYQALHGLPRHLGQHSGGMIISQGRLSSVVPLENASMPGRSVAQWDKEDCEQLGIIKVDLLGLGMMSVLQDTVALCAAQKRPVDLATIPKDDPATYDLLCAADTIGVFQVESRAQMATLPRMQPRCFYDVCIEVAIIRPGPIQGDLVHPYLARRNGELPELYDDERLLPVLKRTLGVPLFQEQLLRIAMVMADFSASEAEELRRALSFHRSPERMAKVTEKLRERMAAKGVASAAIERIARSVGSFALYGFPESHAISFAILAYASAWLKVHRAPEFYASLFNNQPMGFYSCATLTRDAQRHGVRVRPPCVLRSQRDCIIEEPAILRLGLRQVRGLNTAHARQLLDQRTLRPFDSLQDLKARVPLDKDEWRTLASIGACNGLAPHRRAALWEVERPHHDDLFSRVAESTPNTPNPPCPLSPMSPGERLEADFDGLGLTTGPHAMALLRPSLQGVWQARELLDEARHGQCVLVAGAVISRQRPGTAKGVVFLSLEDETGIANIIISPKLFEEQRLLIVHARFLLAEGTVQIHRGVLHIKAHRVQHLPEDLQPHTRHSPQSETACPLGWRSQ